MGKKSFVIVDDFNEGPDFPLKQGWIKSQTAEILALYGEMYHSPVLFPRTTVGVALSWLFAA